MTDDLWTQFGAHGRGAIVTIKRNGRPQLSTVDFLTDAGRGTLRFSTCDGLAKVANLRRDPRASMYVNSAGGYAVAEGTVEITPVSADPHDATVDELVEVYRGIVGEHPDWDEYRAAMVTDRRVVVCVRVEKLYGWGG